MRIRTEDGKQARYLTEHSMTLHGNPIRYRVVAEECILEEESGKALASVFSYSYFRTDNPDSSASTGSPDAVVTAGKQRPVLFAYNGGPGSSSAWLHLGLFGAKRVKLSDAVNPMPLPPYALEDNPHCMLDLCDFVMIDPVGTGYARLLSEDAASQMYGVRQDARVTALFIENWLNRYQRHDSPRFLAGESYGTIRSCMLLRELMGGPFAEDHRLLAIPVSGVILLGTAITLNRLNNVPAVYPDVLKLTSRAAVYHYHFPQGKPPVAEFTAEAWAFAGGEYLAGLFAGERLSAAARAALCRRLEAFTGIPAAWYDTHDLTASDEDFRSMVLAGRGLDVGAYDGRYTMAHSEQVRSADPVADDPAMGKYTPAFLGAMNGGLRKALAIPPDREYRAIDFAVNGCWDYTTSVPPTEALTAAMRRNESLRVFFGSGYYDLVTPPGMVRYLADHLNLPKERITIREYESGHMPYLGEESAALLESDLREFISIAAEVTQAEEAR